MRRLRKEPLKKETVENKTQKNIKDLETALKKKHQPLKKNKQPLWKKKPSRKKKLFKKNI